MEKDVKSPRKRQTIDREQVSKRLYFIRNRLGLTKTAFADSLSMTKSNYGQVEKGTRMLSVEQIYNLFVVHGVPMEYIIAGQETHLPDTLK